MQTSLSIIPTLSDKIIENPEMEEIRCRICYQEFKPLITLCQCSGTIAYVHEECILDWITKKMENAETVEIPKCQICRVTYSAKLKIGHKKICYGTLFKKVKELKTMQILISLFFLLGTIIAFYANSKILFYLISTIFASLQSIPELIKSLGPNTIVDLFTFVVFPIFFLRQAMQNGKRRMKLWDDSMVQIVQLTLNPKITIKQ